MERTFVAGDGSPTRQELLPSKFELTELARRRNDVDPFLSETRCGAKHGSCVNHEYDATDPMLSKQLCPEDGVLMRRMRPLLGPYHRLGDACALHQSAHRQ